MHEKLELMNKFSIINFNSKKRQRIFPQICFRLEEYREKLTFHDFFQQKSPVGRHCAEATHLFLQIAVLLENLFMNSHFNSNIFNTQA